MIRLRRFNPSDKKEWDDFIEISRANTFLFFRDFVDYHRDRFDDFSIMVYKKDKLEAVLPGNIKDNIFFSHQGLTYGGLVSSAKITAIDVLVIFEELSIFLRSHKIKEVYYKPLPIIYHKQPMQEDIYALYRLKAKKVACNVSSTIFKEHKIPFTESRKSGIRKSKRFGVTVNESDDFKSFWDILDYNLSLNHGVKPVHTLDEIIKLKNLFPERIKLISSCLNGKIIAGSVLFLMGNLIHVQYISASEEGKQIGALDLMFDEIINTFFSSFSIIDFGHSNEDSGNYLNEGLIFQKIGFGGRGVVYEIFNYKI